jgi:hypothetical protein
MGSRIKVKTPWIFKLSVFKDYKLNTNKLIEECLAFDWALSKLDKLLRNEENIRNTKEFIKTHYRLIKEAFKYFAMIEP